MPYDFAWEIADAADEADYYDDRPTAADEADEAPEVECGCSDRLCPCEGR